MVRSPLAPDRDPLLPSVVSLSDEDLMAQVAEDDERAFTELVRRFQSRVCNLISRVLNDRETVDDLEQEVFVRVHIHRRSYRRGSKFSTWVFTIAANLAKNEIRRRVRRRNWFSLDALQEVLSDSIPQLADPTENREQGLEREQLQGEVGRAIATVPEKDRLALVLRRLAGLPGVEVAPGVGDCARAGARGARPAPDRGAAEPNAPRWVPMTAAAALVVIAFATLIPYVAGWRSQSTASNEARVSQPRMLAASATALAPRAVANPTGSPAREGAAIDSLFDHADDVEFILDPVTLHRGRARAATRAANGIQGEQAVISSSFPSPRRCRAPRDAAPVSRHRSRQPPRRMLSRAPPAPRRRCPRTSRT